MKFGGEHPFNEAPIGEGDVVEAGEREEYVRVVHPRVQPHRLRLQGCLAHKETRNLPIRKRISDYRSISPIRKREGTRSMRLPLGRVMLSKRVSVKRMSALFIRVYSPTVSSNCGGLMVEGWA